MKRSLGVCKSHREGFGLQDADVKNLSHLIYLYLIGQAGSSQGWFPQEFKIYIYFKYNLILNRRLALKELLKK